MDKPILFIGNHLSFSTGTLGVSEKVVTYLALEGYKCNLVSRYSNQIARLLDILISICFTKYRIAHIDVFSGKAFLIAQLSAILLKVRSKRIIMTLHGGKLPEFTEANKTRVIKTFKRAYQIQTPSLYLLNYFKGFGLNIEYVPNPIDLELFRFQEKPVVSFGDSPKLLWVRAFTSIYNPDLPVKILNIVKMEYPKATLTMIGPDKGLLPEIKNLVRTLNLEDSVIFQGSVPNSKLEEYYHSHHVFLNTTSYESFGVAVVEAAACGIPMVSTNVGEIPFLWENEKEIIIVKNQNEVELARGVLKLLNDSVLYHSMRIKARDKAETFSWNKIKPYWLKIMNL